MNGKPCDEVVFNQAVGFLHSRLQQGQDMPRCELLARCAAQLCQSHDISQKAAEDITIRAYGEVSGRGVREYIDLSRTTSTVLTLRDPASGVMRMLTVADLLRLIGPAQHAPLRLVYAVTH